MTPEDVTNFIKSQGSKEAILAARERCQNDKTIKIAAERFYEQQILPQLDEKSLNKHYRLQPYFFAPSGKSAPKDFTKLKQKLIEKPIDISAG